MICRCYAIDTLIRAMSMLDFRQMLMNYHHDSLTATLTPPLIRHVAEIEIGCRLPRYARLLR